MAVLSPRALALCLDKMVANNANFLSPTDRPLRQMSVVQTVATLHILLRGTGWSQNGCDVFGDVCEKFLYLKAGACAEDKTLA